KRGLDQRGNEPTVTSQLDAARVDLCEQGIKLSRGLQLLDQVLARGATVILLLLVRHGHDSYRSSRHGLHRPSDTPKWRKSSPMLGVIDLLIQRRPKFVYFGEYDS